MANFPQSPFYRKLSGSEPLDVNSSKIIARWSADMGGNLKFGSADAWSHPIYNGCATEYPSYRIELIETWAKTTQGMSVKLASTARPEGVASIHQNGDIDLVSWGDGHLSVQEKDGYQYDFWQVRHLGGGLIRAQFGGRAALNGDGRGASACALNHALGLGDIRGQDITNNIVDQGLFAIAKQCNGQRNTTEFGNGSTGSHVDGATDRPAMGQRLHYRMTDSQIDAYYQIPWQRYIARRFAHYGIVIGDTGGGCLKGESPLPWKTTGQVSPLSKIGTNFSMRVDWTKVVVIKNGA